MRKGFTLMEMIIAVFLSTMVLLGIIAVAASMVRQHFESISQGEVSGQTLLSLDQMNNEIENANSLVAPNSTTTSGNVLSSCENWSLLYGQALNSAPNAQVESYYYCAAPTKASVHEPGAYDLWRYSCKKTVGSPGSNICPFPALGGACGVGSAPAVAGATCSGPVNVIYNALYLEPSFGNFFYYDFKGGVDMHYIVGYPQRTSQRPTPVSYQIDNAVMMQKSPGDASD